MLIAHVSDFHVFADRAETSLVRPDAAEAARRIVADMAAFRPAIDSVAFTGDLVDGGSAENYALLLRLLSPLSVPIFAVPGNHDGREHLRAAFRTRLPFEDAVFLHYETECRGVRVLGLDTLVAGRIEGRLCEKRLRWIETRLSRRTPQPLLIAMHHPPFATGLAALDAMALVEGAERLFAMLADWPATVRILCGHIHRPVHGVVRRHFVAIAGSPAFQVGLELAPDAAEPGLLPEPYAYFIHRLDARGDFAVHSRYVEI